MSREVFLQAARVHAKMAVAGAAAGVFSAGKGYLFKHFEVPEDEADIALAWLALANKEHPGLLAAEEVFSEQRELGLQQELASARTQLRLAKELARHAIECVEASTYKGDGLVAGLKYRLEEIK